MVADGRYRVLRSEMMKRHLVVLAICAGLGSATEAEAGCLTGAAVGGVASHLAGRHGVVGAAVGCAVAIIVLPSSENKPR